MILPFSMRAVRWEWMENVFPVLFRDISVTRANPLSFFGGERGGGPQGSHLPSF